MNLCFSLNSLAKSALLTFALLFSLALVGCDTQTPMQDADILTQKAIPSGKKPITVLVKHAFAINSFEKAVEEKFPEIDIIQVGNFSRDMGIEEYKSRLEHDDLTDIVMTWPLDVGSEYWADRLLDLSGFYFTSNYQLSMLNEISKDGKLYYLPGPAQVRGIVYNKTLFEENNWALPTNYNEFVTLCQTIEKTGIRSLQLGLGNSEVLDTAFVGFGYEDCFSKPQDAQWISEYNSGVGKFADHFSSALSTFSNLIDNGILKASDLEITYSDREKMLFTRQCAMIEDSVLMARMGSKQTGTDDKFALMPFFNPNGGSDWSRLYMVCYIGLNKHLAEPNNKEKYDKVIQIMEYISSPEGQEALMYDNGAMFSSLNGVDLPQVSEIDALVPSLSGGRFAIFPQLKNAQQALRQGLAGMVAGKLTASEVCAMVDEQNASPPLTAPPDLLGSATTNFSLKDTGAFITDSMRSATGCEIALFLDNGKDGKTTGKGLSASLYKGDVTAADIDRILPDLKHGDKGLLWKVFMSGKDLIKTLEYSIPVDNNATGWFYYFSGLEMRYDISADPGERIKDILMSDGSKIDPNKNYTIAIMGGTVPEECIISYENTNITITQIVSETVKELKTITPASDGRFISN